MANSPLNSTFKGPILTTGTLDIGSLLTLNTDAGTSGWILTSQGAGFAPIWAAAGSSGISALGAVGSSPNANAAIISGGTTLILEPANDTYPGVVSTTTQTFAGIKTFSNPILAGSTYSASTYTLKAGSLLLQGQALNNSYLLDNAYYSGAAWTRDVTGYAEGVQLYNGQMLFFGAASGTGTFSQSISMKTDKDGAFAVGTGISTTPGVLTGANFVIDSTGRLGLGNAAPASKFQIGPDIAGSPQVKTMAVSDSTTTDYANIWQGNSSVSTARVSLILSNSSSSFWEKNLLQFSVHGSIYPSNFYMTDIPSKVSDAGWTLLWSQGTENKGLGLFTYNSNPVILGTNNSTRLYIASTGEVTLSKDLTLTTGVHNSGVANGASAIGFKLNTSATYSTSGAKLASFQNNSVEKAYVDKDGNFSGNNLVITTSAQAIDGAKRFIPHSLTSTGASIAIDLALGNNFSHTTTENTTLVAPSNSVAGQSGVIVITQNGSTPHTLAYNSFWKFPGGVVPTLTATASAVDVLTYYVESATRATCSLIKDVK